MKKTTYAIIATGLVLVMLLIHTVYACSINIRAADFSLIINGGSACTTPYPVYVGAGFEVHGNLTIQDNVTVFNTVGNNFIETMDGAKTVITDDVRIGMGGSVEDDCTDFDVAVGCKDFDEHFDCCSNVDPICCGDDNSGAMGWWDFFCQDYIAIAACGE